MTFRIISKKTCGKSDHDVLHTNINYINAFLVNHVNGNFNLLSANFGNSSVTKITKYPSMFFILWDLSGFGEIQQVDSI